MQENCLLYISINKTYPHVKSDALGPQASHNYLGICWQPMEMDF